MVLFCYFRGSLNVCSYGLDLISVWLLYNSRFSNSVFIIKFSFLFSSLRNSISLFWLRISWSLWSAFPFFEFDTQLYTALYHSLVNTCMVCGQLPDWAVPQLTLPLGQIPDWHFPDEDSPTEHFPTKTFPRPDISLTICFSDIFFKKFISNPFLFVCTNIY